MLYDGFTEIDVMMIGGWKSQRAFRRYVRSDEISLQIKMGIWSEPDETWKKELAPR